MSADTTGILQLASNNGTVGLTLDTSQNVGIGTSSPAQKLDVASTTGNIAISVRSSFANASASVFYGASRGWFVGADVGGGNGQFAWYDNTAAAERMRIDSSGNVQIGTTSANGAKLYINGIVASSSGYRWDTASSGARGLVTTGSSLYALSANGTTFGYGVSTNVAGGLDIMANQEGQNISFYCGTSNASPTRRLFIGGGGDLVLEGSTAQKATGTTWSNPSDVRLKDNIQDYTKGLPELMQVNVKTWEYNGKAGTVKGTKGLGVIADEIQELLPDTVDNYKAKLNADDAEDTDIKKFDATEITWLMLKSIQEQQVMIQELNAKVTALEEQVLNLGVK
jgi:hypothetical protein